jgi:2-(1,2-epoxy-1,2-dihydrophenyl)acetyl-CoA isomerase
LDITDGVAKNTLNRPEKDNALDQPMADALLATALHCSNDPKVRCVVLTGAGKMFCVGGDISELASNGDAITPFLTRLAGTLHQALSQFAAMNKPMITLVNGTTAGAGLRVAISGDIVLADPQAKFTTAYLGIGVTPDGGMTWLLPRLMGMRAALAAQLSAGAVSAIEQARKLLHESFSSGFASQMGRELSSITAAGNGPEGREGINAFLAKRKPNFQGSA